MRKILIRLTIVLIWILEVVLSLLWVPICSAILTLGLPICAIVYVISGKSMLTRNFHFLGDECDSMDLIILPICIGTYFNLKLENKL